MKHLTSIVAFNEQGVIGTGNRLPWRLKTDLQFFKDTTVGSVVIMGRKTFDSLGKPLPGRYNIVLSHNAVLFTETDNSKIATSVNEALVHANLRRVPEVFVIGGASIYTQFAPYVDRYLMTQVCKPVPEGDAFFDEALLGDQKDWDLRLLDHIRCSPAVDEADFSVFEANHVKTEEVAAKRQRLIEAWRLKAGSKPRVRTPTVTRAGANFAFHY